MRTLSTILLLIGFVAQAQNSTYSDQVLENYDAGINAYASNNSDLAKTLFASCITEDSSCFEAYLGLGLIAYEEQDFYSSLNFCNSAKKLRPFDPDLSGLMGKAHFQTGNFTQAEILLKRAISTGNDSNENQLALAVSLQRIKKYEDAQYYFDALVEQSPDLWESWVSRGLLYMEIGSLEAAKTDFIQGLKLNPKNASICINLTKTCFALAEDEQALGYADMGLENANEQEKIDLLLLKGNYYREKGEYEKARGFFDEAYALNNSNGLILTHQAAVLIDLEEYESAIEKCTAAIALEPEQMQAYFNRGIANEMIRNIDGACSDWQKAFVLGSQKAIEYLNGPVCNE